MLNEADFNTYVDGRNRGDGEVLVWCYGEMCRY